MQHADDEDRCPDCRQPLGPDSSSGAVTTVMDVIEVSGGCTVREFEIEMHGRGLSRTETADAVLRLLDAGLVVKSYAATPADCACSDDGCFGCTYLMPVLDVMLPAEL